MMNGRVSPLLGSLSREGYLVKIQKGITQKGKENAQHRIDDLGEHDITMLTRDNIIFTYDEAALLMSIAYYHPLVTEGTHGGR